MGLKAQARAGRRLGYPFGMPPTESTMVPLGTPAPHFSLPNVDGRTVQLADFAGAPALVVMFLCNHCPFVVHVRGELARLYGDYAPRGVAFVGINANDADQYPDDSPENMRLRADEWGWSFPYLFDETQLVAASYGAACTPDIYLFDGEQKLVYRGRLDDSRPGTDRPVNGADLRHALDAVLAGEMPNPDQKPSIGCSIKWKPSV